jgi:hypothetical protein
MNTLFLYGTSKNCHAGLDPAPKRRHSRESGNPEDVDLLNFMDSR